ncbi:MAG: hypothetical protein NTW29_01250 [Bacteroidetes bacterium]|nr:hypothetical protein [Bacteroidota bacterium]
MKFTFTNLFLLLAFPACFSQGTANQGEFATNSNGLIYGISDMQHLRFIVDSLNLRFKTCDLTRNYTAMPQTRHYYISFSSKTNDLKEIITDINNGATFEAVRQKYKELSQSVDTQRLMIQSGKNDDGKRIFLAGTPSTGYSSIYGSELANASKEGLPSGWVFDYDTINEYRKSYHLVCYFFPEPWRMPTLPADYSKLIQYVDCMIDTAASILLTDDKPEYRWIDKSKERKLLKHKRKLMAFFDETAGKKISRSDGFLTDDDLNLVGPDLINNEKFKALLTNAIEESLAKKLFDNTLELIAEKAGMYDKALSMKRSYRVVGMCSMDNSPRLHARDIALLSARAHQWDIFLRAHLDIMNDRFERASDGSYAWGERQTYLKELEELNLDVVDLMLGLTLRAGNTASNHYYGKISRMGRALAESREKARFEERAITIMKDNRLDEFNRGLMFLLYYIYTDYLDNKEGKLKRDLLRNQVDQFPSFLQTSILKMKESDKTNNEE